jgi:AraC-like DNA-binding protein
MRIQFFPAAPSLTSFVRGYLYAEDLSGAFAGRVLQTCPEPTAVLAVNFAKGALDEAGRPHPGVSLLGIQERLRSWRLRDESLFLAAFLTPSGLAALFPCTGAQTANSLVALHDVAGDRVARTLRDALDPETSPGAPRDAMERWLADRLDRSAGTVGAARPGLLETLLATRSVAGTCRETGVHPRALQRHVKRHLGVTPQTLLNLDRLRASVSEVRHGNDAGIPGLDWFSDQPHQIRAWNRHVRRTPGRYRRDGPSEPARMMTASATGRPSSVVFWL